MLSTYWVKKRRPYWAELENLVNRSEKGGLRRLDHQEVQRLALLYRQSAADLSTLRQDPSGKSYGRYLSPLLSRAHNIIYASEPSDKKRFLRFFTHDYPQVFRANLAYVMAALALFAVSALVAIVLTWQDPDFAREVLGPGMMASIEKREMWTHSIVAIKPVASSQITTNNMAVAFTMFSMGITAGIGTVLLTVFNGVLLGVVATACWSAGMSLKLWSFVVPHGSLELPAIVIAAGAGLRLAAGLLFPGHLPRRDSVIAGGSDAIKLLLGAIPMLAIAGAIEGFISPTDLAVAWKFLLGGALFVLLNVYLFLPMAKDRAAKADSSL
jgi:uncharacterized membrane protein SpoIIM required for sporulation